MHARGGCTGVWNKCRWTHMHPLATPLLVTRKYITVTVGQVLNTWCMREGYISCSVCLSVTALAVTYLVFFKSQVRCYKVLYGVSKVCIVWISLKMLHFPVLVSFAFSHCLHYKFLIYNMNNRDSNGFFSRKLVRRSSDSSYNLTGSSLIIANYQRLLPFFLI